MYRRFQTNFGKTKDAMFTASEDMVKGMLVVKDFTNSTVALPASAVGTGVYLVDVNPQYTGLMSVETNISDYDDRLNDIASGDAVSLELLEVGETYGTDQFTATSIVVGSYLQAGTDGKLALYAGTSSPLVAVDIAYSDAGNTLLKFAVTDTPFVA